jgi:hypothetical protein
MGGYPFRPDFRMRRDLGGAQTQTQEEHGLENNSDEEDTLVNNGVNTSESSNPNIQRLDGFLNNSIEVLNYVADTMEKGDELNKSLERAITALVTLILDNPIVKALIELLKEFIAKKTVEIINKSSDSNDSFKELLSAVIESPAVKELIVEVIGKTMGDSNN